MLSVTAAETLIQSLVISLAAQDPATAIEQVPLSQAFQRILAQPVSSPLDFPHWDNSAMDGYAIRYEDVCPEDIRPEDIRPEDMRSKEGNEAIVRESQGLSQNLSEGLSEGLKVIETIAAGVSPQFPLKPGEAARIFTGAILPPGADTIVPQEATERQDDRLYVREPPARRGAFVRKQGDFYQAGSPLLAAGLRIGSADLAVLAAAQCYSIPVYRPLRVAIFSTGNELVPPDYADSEDSNLKYSNLKYGDLKYGNPLPPGKIVDSNQIALISAVQRLGAIALPWGIVPDDPLLLKKTIADILPQVDVILSSGGVSVGDYDYVEAILEELGATLAIRSVAVKPGKPLTIATFPHFANTPIYFGLPGNPVSSLVSFWRFVQPALEKMSGLNPLPRPYFKTGYTTQVLESDGQRETYLWGRAEWQEGASPGYWFTPARGSKSSGNLIHLSQANALAKLAVGEQRIEVGSPVSLRLL